MKTNTRFSHLLLTVIGLISAVVACTDHTNPNLQSDIRLATTSLGSVLTGQDGKTLYFFANDADGKANCVGGCANVWPAFYKENPSLGTGLAAADFATITRPDGAKQTTFKGWPLHYYANDTRAGDVRGEGVGNIWFVAKPNYSVMIGNFQLTGHDGKTYTSALVEGTGRTMFFVDGLGRTLYTFSRDTKNKNTFTSADFSNNATWPIFEGVIGEVPSIIDKALFSMNTVAGRQQPTYKGWPLYYFGQDAQQRGSTKGVSFPRPGVWPIANKDLPEAP